MKQTLFFRNVNKRLSVMAFSLVLLFITQYSNAQTITSNQTGTNNGFYFSYWNQGAGTTSFTGVPSMTLGAAGNYNITWSCKLP